MAGRNPQSIAKRARELAVKERRDRKRAKKLEAAAQRTLDAQSTEPEAISDTSARR
jgi:hypothetical protein